MGALFSRPKQPEPVRMPNQNDAQAIEAQRRTRRTLMSRQGRESTRLEGGGMGNAYRGSLLGNAG